jgi:ATP-dependent Clp endopeptidase proteolytic subunit ClpP
MQLQAENLLYVSNFISGTGSDPKSSNKNSGKGEAESASEATMLLYGEIGGADGINGTQFANELYELESLGIERCTVRINSPGGSVLDGYSIFSAIQNTGMRVDTCIDGMAASIAGVIAMAGKSVRMASHGLLMLHNPSLEGKGDDNKAAKEQEVLDAIKNSLVTIYSEKRGQNPDAIAGMMNKETWLSASEAMEHGLVDEIFDNSRMPKLDLKELSPKAMYLITNSILENNMEKPKPENQSAATLQAENEQLRQLLQELQEKYDALLKEQDRQTEIAAKEIVDSAISEGRIQPESKTAWVAIAKTDLVNTRRALNSIRPAAATAAINMQKPASLASQISHSAPTGRAAWTIRDWEKKDPSGLLRLKSEQPEVYRDMYNSFYIQKP